MLYFFVGWETRRSQMKRIPMEREDIKREVMRKYYIRANIKIVREQK